MSRPAGNAGRPRSASGQAADPSAGPAGERSDRAARLNLLLPSCGWRRVDELQQIPALLGPMGISSHLCRSVEEAEALVRSTPIHIAVVDMEMPLRSGEAAAPGGPRVLELLRRLDQPPPVVVVRPRQATARESGRSLASALQQGAFSVLDRPLRLEAMLETMRRVLQRHYADAWPDDPEPPRS